MFDERGIEATFAKRALEGAGDALVVVDPDGRIVWANDAVGLIGWEPGALVGQVLTDIVAAADLEQIRQGARAIARGFRLPSSVPVHLLRPDGSLIECDLASSPIGTPTHLEAVMVHIRPTQDSRILRELLDRLLVGEPAPMVLESLLELLYHRSTWIRVVVLLTDPDDGALVLGTVPDPSLAGVGAGPGTPWWRVQHGEAAEVVTPVADLPREVAAVAAAAGLAECWVVPVHSDGEHIATVTAWGIVEGPTVRLDPYSLRLLVQLVELVWRWWRQTLALERAATLDPLTGLPNRRVFDESALTAQNFSRGVLYIDLDRFKPVNDGHGHGAGDQVLRTVAHRLLACVRPSDRVMRLGGDEFGVVVPGCSPAELEEVARRIIDRISDPITVHGAVVRIGASIGAALGSGPVEALFEQADAALYDAKAAGRGELRWAGG